MVTGNNVNRVGGRPAPLAAHPPDGSDLSNPERTPKLTPEGQLPQEAEEFIDSCLVKDPDVRMTSKDLLVSSLMISVLHV